MFCQRCGAEAPEQSKFCKQCGSSFKSAGFHISNTALVIAAIAAVVALGAAFLPIGGSDDTRQIVEAESTPIPRVTATPPYEEPKLTETQVKQMIAEQVAAQRPQPAPRERERPTPTPEIRTVYVQPPPPQPTPLPPMQPTQPCRTPLAPFNGSTYPRNFPFIIFQWVCARRPDAREYKLEIQYQEPTGEWLSLWDLTLPSDSPPIFRCQNFNDPKPGRWKITVYLQDGRSEASPWIFFRRL